MNQSNLDRIVADKPEEQQQSNRRDFMQDTGRTIGAVVVGGVTAYESVLAGQARAEQDGADMDNRELVQEIQEHVDADHVQWVTATEMLENHRLDCIDGRCTDCVAGTPGGDMGDLLLKLTAVEKVTGKKLDPHDAQGILERYLEHREGGFYMHTDSHALENLAKAMNMEPERNAHWKNSIESLLHHPGSQNEEALLTALTEEKNIGCGHLRLMLGNANKYPGSQPELLKSLIRAFFQMKWNGRQGSKIEYVVLNGNHAEKAVLQVVSDDPISDETLVPLITPCLKENKEDGDGHQVFIVYPDLERLSEERFAEFAEEVSGFQGIDKQKLLATMRELRPQYLNASAEKLVKKGRPVLTAHFNQKKTITIES